MARKKLTREVTFTEVELGQIIMENGKPEVKPLPKEVLIGNLSIEDAQKQILKNSVKGTVVLDVTPNTKKYEMDLLYFIENATPIDEQLELDIEE